MPKSVSGLKKENEQSKIATQYFVYTIVNSDSEVDREEIIIAMAEAQNQWHIFKKQR